MRISLISGGDGTFCGYVVYCRSHIVTNKKRYHQRQLPKFRIYGTRNKIVLYM